MDVHDESFEEHTDEAVQTDRRGFFRDLKKWSAIVLAGVGLGSAAKQSRAGWLNRRGGAGWLNNPGGGGWINRRGGGGWLNGRR